MCGDEIVRHAGGNVKRTCNGWEADKRMQIVNPFIRLYPLR
jgi:hypothetical protein